MQATYAELGIAEADLVQAGRMTNPHFAYLRTSAGGAQKLEWALTFPIIDLLTMPLRTRIEGHRFEQVKLAVAGRMLEVATETRKSWIETVAAEASSDLANRMERAGNFNRLDRMREEVFHSETAARLARARQEAVAERERLTRRMGLSGNDIAFQRPERLPDLPADTLEIRDIEGRAMTGRLDVQAAKRETEALAASLGLTRATRFINVLELGPVATKEDPGPWMRGYEVSLQLPIFDWGGARVAKAEAIYMQSLHRVAETAVNAGSEVRSAYSAYHTAYDTAKRYRDEIVPLRKKIAEENMLRYNGMLIGVFDLLADAREQVAAVTAYIDALRAFEFLADAPGDWAFHCHKSHHLMNAMGHGVPTMIGVDQRGVAEKINKLLPDYMAMGERGMAEMGGMEMPLPDNTLPMMTGQGPFGPIEMGGMFTVVKIREGLARDDYKDPGWYKHPKGSLAHEWKGALPAS